MDEILKLAEQLGKLMAADPRARRVAEARIALNNSKEDRQWLSDYEVQQQKVYELETRGTPIEPGDKRKLADLHAKVVGSEAIKELMKAQADFVELTSAVSQRIEQEVMGNSASV